MAIDYEVGRLCEMTGWPEKKVVEALHILIDLADRISGKYSTTVKHQNEIIGRLSVRQQELYQRIAELEDENRILKKKEAATNEAKEALNNKCIDKEKD